MKFKLKKRWVIFTLAILLLVYSLERRSFYCLDNGKCLTVWKSFTGCYIIPYKYYGVLTPNTGYIKTDKAETYVDFFWINNLSDSIFFRVAPKENLVEVKNNSSKGILLYNYDDNKEEFHNILFNKDNRAKKNISLFRLDIRWNYVISSKSSVLSDISNK